MLTSAVDFYIRSHGNIPRVDPCSYRLAIGSAARVNCELSLAEIKEYNIKSS